LNNPVVPHAAFVLPVDDLEWTKHWLGKLRCDQLIISIARRTETHPRIRIRAVESKSTSKVEPIEPNPAVEPFAEGCGQVTATLDALWDLVAPDAEKPLIEDLRFSSFCEHIASVALSDLYPLSISESEELNILQFISDFSQRRVEVEDIELDGAVVCTQYRTAVPRRVTQHEVAGTARSWGLFLVRAGTGELQGLLGDTATEFVIDATAPAPAGASARGEVAQTEVPGSVRSAIEVGAPETDDQAPQEQRPRPEAPSRTVAPTPEVTWQQSMANDLQFACRQRGFRVQLPEATHIVTGPSLVAVSMALEAGESIRPIEAALDDLAREVGVASISVENDPDRPFYIRFLLPRPDRVFPSLPEQVAPIVEVESQSYVGVYLGQTLEGGSYPSFLSSWPHMLVGGTTGSGKTTFIRSIVRQFDRFDPALIKLVLVDGKGEIDYLNIIPAEYFPERFDDVILGHQNVLEILEWVVESEIPRRRNLMLERARETHGERPRQARDLFVDAASREESDPFPALIVVIDEFAEIMLADRQIAQRFEQRVQQITQVGRSSLVHLILATQRPDASVVSGAIKANLDARIALRLPTHHDSMTILGGRGAERLLGRGDLLFRAAGHPLIRLQGFDA
jgi:hypothetical protein